LKKADFFGQPTWEGATLQSFNAQPQAPAFRA
jgi:hypothetical protein